MTDDNDKPVRGVNTIREELDKERNDNTYKSAFGALAMAVVGTIIAYVGYEYANTIYVWLWIGTGIAWIVGIGMLVFGKSMEDERHKKIAELEAELAEAMAARDGGRSRSDGAAATHGRSSVSATADAVKPEPTSPASPVLPPVPAVGATASASVAAPPMPGPAPRTAPARVRLPVPMPGTAPLPLADETLPATGTQPVPLPTGAPAAATHGATTTPSRDFKFCGQCGARIKRDVAFCTQCGARAD